MNPAGPSTIRRPTRGRTWALVALLVLLAIAHRWSQSHLANRKEINRLSRELQIVTTRNHATARELEQYRESYFRLTERIERLELERKLMGERAAVQGMTLSGEPFTWDDYRGKVVLLDAWAARYRGPIDPQWARLKQLHRDFHGRGLEILGLNKDFPEYQPEARAFLAQNEIPWPHLARQGWTPPTVNGEDVEWIPERILVDREGRIVMVSAELTDEFIARVESLLGPP